jgi:hypothetical protein
LNTYPITTIYSGDGTFATSTLRANPHGHFLAASGNTNIFTRVWYLQFDANGDDQRHDDWRYDLLHQRRDDTNDGLCGL